MGAQIQPANSFDPPLLLSLKNIKLCFYQNVEVISINRVDCMDRGKYFTPMDPNLQVTNIKEVNEHIFKGGVIVILCDVNLQCILLRLKPLPYHQSRIYCGLSRFETFKTLDNSCLIRQVYEYHPESGIVIFPLRVT